MSTHILSCDQCEYSGLGIHRLRIHKKIHEPMAYDTAKVPCHICGKEISGTNMTFHINAKHSTGEQSFKCDQCEFVTHAKGYLITHKKRHLKKKLKCPVCGRMVKFLDAHMSRGNCFKTEGKFPCDLCNKVFKDNYKVKRHVKQIHMKIKDFICDICDYKTYSSTNLKIHSAKMHTKEPLEVHCHLCNQKTMNLDHHKKTHHFEEYCKENQASQVPRWGQKDEKVDLVAETL